MGEHIEAEELSLYVDQQGDGGFRLKVEFHLQHCQDCAQEVENIERFKLRLSSIPKPYAPPALISALRRTYVQPQSSRWRSVSFLWKPVGAFAVLVLVGAIWMFRPTDNPQDHVDLDALLEAHSKYQMESLVPRADMTRSDYSARLASFYRDEE